MKWCWIRCSNKEHSGTRKLEGEPFLLFHTFSLSSRPRHCGEFCITVVKQIKQNVWVLRRQSWRRWASELRLVTEWYRKIPKVEAGLGMAGHGPWLGHPNPFSSDFEPGESVNLRRLTIRRQGHWQLLPKVKAKGNICQSFWGIHLNHCQSSREAWTGSSWAANHVLVVWTILILMFAFFCFSVILCSLLGSNEPTTSVMQSNLLSWLQECSWFRRTHFYPRPTCRAALANNQSGRQSQ